MQTLSWFPLSLVATLLFGIAIALYKLPSAINHNRFATTFYSFLSATALSVVFFHPYLFLSTPTMILIALVCGFTFTSVTLLQMYALSHVDTNVLFPITTTASLIITVLIGIFFLDSNITTLQSLGIILAILTITLFLYKGGKIQYSMLFIGVSSGIIFLSAFNKIIQKIVADIFDIHAFQIYQHLFAAIFALILFFIFHHRDWKDHIFSGGLGIGIVIGVLGFFGSYALYSALTVGPFPLITSIHSLYILITAIAAYFLFQEQLTTKKSALLIVAIVAVILMRVG